MHINSLPVAHYPELLSEKVDKVKALFADLPLPNVDVFPSAPSHFRMRAEFRIWHEGDDLFYAMFDPSQPKIPVRVDSFPIADRQITRLMPPLLAAIKASAVLRRQLFQVEFLSSQRGETLVTLIYHRRLDDDWQTAARRLATELGVQLIGRSRKQRLVLDREYVQETLFVNGQPYHYKQYEGGFTQPNVQINQHMIEWATARLPAPQQGDLLELYCGNGNFTIPLADCFRQVLATEISKTSVRSALENFALNNIGNARVVRMSSEEFTQALNGERAFRRLQDCPLYDFNFSTVFVDPPRAGLDSGTLELVSRFPAMLYISCNPLTLHRDIQLLTKSHRLQGFALFDQFPYTDHMECGAYLTRGI